MTFKVDKRGSDQLDNLARDNAIYLEEGYQRISIDSSVTYVFLKRILDVVVASIGFIVLSPLFLIIAILIKLENPRGSVIFTQNRVGFKGKKFKMYKFRSMHTDAEEKLEDLLLFNEVDGAMFKMKDDPRITKIGKFIRRTSIDELPQFLNVIKGDMSLVGPRPPLPREVVFYNNYEKQRLIVKPGCTGLWQISGRNSLGFRDMVNLDLEYIQKRSFIYDFKILFKTVWVIIRPNEAY